MAKLILLLIACFSISAQSLSLACPQPPKNQAAVCPLTFNLATPALTPTSSLQWILTTSPPISGVTATSLVSGKQIALGTNGTMMLIGVNATPLTGAVASITIPKRSGVVSVRLSNIIGSSASGHAVQVIPAVSVNIQ